LSIALLFLLCVRASVASLRYELYRCVFIVLQCFATPQNFKCIVGRRIGLPGFYRGGALIATGVLWVKFGFLGDVGDRSGQGGSAMSMIAEQADQSRS
jgi:hypothetical protein